MRGWLHFPSRFPLHFRSRHTGSRKVMPEKKHEQSGFKVTDRRLFTSDGELRNDVPEEPAAPQTQPVQTESDPPVQAESAPPAAKASVEVAEAAPEPEREMPLPPSASEQEAQATAYRQSSKDLDSQVELSGHSAKDFEMTFERFMASLYMTAMLQLGMMREQGGQPRID